MRVHITNLAIALTLFILLMFIVVLVVVYVTVDYIPPVGQCPAAGLPMVWDDASHFATVYQQARQAPPPATGLTWS